MREQLHLALHPEAAEAPAAATVPEGMPPDVTAEEPLPLAQPSQSSARRPPKAKPAPRKQAPAKARARPAGGGGGSQAPPTQQTQAIDPADDEIEIINETERQAALQKPKRGRSKKAAGKAAVTEAGDVASSAPPPSALQRQLQQAADAEASQVIKEESGESSSGSSLTSDDSE